MKIQFIARIMPVAAAAIALFSLLVARPAAAQSLPTLGPILTYSVVTLPQPTPGIETIEFGLSGYVFSPGGLSTLSPALLSHYTIVSFGESGFEQQGGVVDYAFGISPAEGMSLGDLDWTEPTDLTLLAHFSTPSVPEDPLPPSDPLPPLDFLVGVATPLPTVNGQPVQLFDQKFTLTNEDGSTETVTPIPYGTPAVPEPSDIALISLGLALLSLTGVRRLRR